MADKKETLYNHYSLVRRKNHLVAIIEVMRINHMNAPEDPGVAVDLGLE